MILLENMSTKINRQLIEEIKAKANENLELIFNLLGIPYDNSYNNEIRCSCPIHDGDDKTAFCFNTDKGYWACYTNLCHEDGKNDIIGLVQKILSKTQQTSFTDALNWLKEKLNIDAAITHENIEFTELDKLLYKERIITKIHKKPENKRSIKDFPFSVDLIKNKIKPSEYFLNQGFDYDILSKYMVGYCDNPYKPMYLRSYAPVLSSDGTNVIGVTGRIQLNKCELCQQYHIPGKGCPVDNPSIKVWPKWFHYGFNTSTTLYNDWNAAEYIRKSNKAVIVEGTKNVWWLEQHDIHNSLCTFGLRILNYHLKKLISMGVTTLILGYDNDINERGQKATEQIKENLSHYFRIETLYDFIPKNQDIANIKSESMKLVKEYIENI